jgi:hypothetical protein
MSVVLEVRARTGMGLRWDEGDLRKWVVVWRERGRWGGGGTGGSEEGWT